MPLAEVKAIFSKRADMEIWGDEYYEYTGNDDTVYSLAGDLDGECHLYYEKNQIINQISMLLSGY
jgi:hypothetical protein